MVKMIRKPKKILGGSYDIMIPFNDRFIKKFDWIPCDLSYEITLYKILIHEIWSNFSMKRVIRGINVHIFSGWGYGYERSKEIYIWRLYTIIYEWVITKVVHVKWNCKKKMFYLSWILSLLKNHFPHVQFNRIFFIFPPIHM